MDRIQRYNALLAFASTNRKQIEKELSAVRNQFLKLKTLVDDAEAEFEAAKSKVDNNKGELSSLKEKLIELTDIIKTMDLTGAEATKERKGNRSYKIRGKDYHVDTSDINNVQVTPWREYVAKAGEGKDIPEAEEEIDEEYGDINDLFMSFAQTEKRYR